MLVKLARWKRTHPCSIGANIGEADERLDDELKIVLNLSSVLPEALELYHLTFDHRHDAFGRVVCGLLAR